MDQTELLRHTVRALDGLDVRDVALHVWVAEQQEALRVDHL